MSGSLLLIRRVGLVVAVRGGDAVDGLGGAVAVPAGVGVEVATGAAASALGAEAVSEGMRPGGGRGEPASLVVGVGRRQQLAAGTDVVGQDLTGLAAGNSVDDSDGRRRTTLVEIGIVDLQPAFSVHYVEH